jgi:hypothetical protein
LPMGRPRYRPRVRQRARGYAIRSRLTTYAHNPLVPATASVAGTLLSACGRMQGAHSTLDTRLPAAGCDSTSTGRAATPAAHSTGPARVRRRPHGIPPGGIYPDRDVMQIFNRVRVVKPANRHFVAICAGCKTSGRELQMGNSKAAQAVLRTP